MAGYSQLPSSTVRIGVRIQEGRVLQLDGSALPRIADGAVGDLVLDAGAILDPEFAARMKAEKTVEMLPRGAEVFLGVSFKHCAGDRVGQLITPSELGIIAPFGFGRAVLQEPLFLRIRGDQRASLARCKCRVYPLNQEARSLNHALTLLSTVFESKRLSHSGNVFAQGYCFLGGEWRRLDTVRLGLVAQHIERSGVPVATGSGGA